MIDRFAPMRFGCIAKIATIASAVAFVALSSVRGYTADCFDPRKDPIISKYLVPDAKYQETQESIAQIHQLIWERRDQIDPRLIYHRIMGESEANPFAVNSSSGAYGLFQLLGKPANSSYSYRAILEELERQSPHTSPRLIQVKYYLEQYLEPYSKAADKGWGCDHQKTFPEYSNLQKVAYLGWGSCTQATLQREISLCVNVASYRSLACPFSEKVILNQNPLPLCNIRPSDFTDGITPKGVNQNSQYPQ